MREPKRTKRRILTAGIGVAAFTALEGIACGNPVAPRWETPPRAYSDVAPPVDDRADAGADADAIPTAAPTAKP